MPITDLAVPTLIEDLKARGLLEETLVVWMGEFGRTPKVENTKQFGPDGRGHWPNCYTVLFAGGGITPGAIYGSSDRIGAYPATDPVSPDDIAATMFWALGIDPATEVTDTLGRPLPIAAGKPITRLFDRVAMTQHFVRSGSQPYLVNGAGELSRLAIAEPPFRRNAGRRQRMPRQHNVGQTPLSLPFARSNYVW